MKFYTVITINRSSGKEMPPRYDLRPMDHMSACNFMVACRSNHTDYRLHEWPEDVPHSGIPLFCAGYRTPSNPTGNHFKLALESRDYLESIMERMSLRLKRFPSGPLGLTPDEVKATPEWQTAKREFDSIMREFRDFNQGFIKHHKHAWREELDRRRSARQPA